MSDISTKDLSIDEAIILFKNEFYRLFPWGGLDSRGPAEETNGEIKYLFKEYMLPCSNASFKGSPYYFKGRRIVHFTKIQTLKDIIKSKVLRLYNLNNMDDPREFSFASRVFNIPEEEIIQSKTELFSISFCEPSILFKANYEEQFNMWRLYGDNGKGVGIVFAIENNLEKWLDFHFANIQYGIDGRRKFEDMIKLLNSINNHTRLLSVDLGKLYPFHKSSLYKGENEVRLIWDNRQNGNKMYGTCTIEQHGEKIWPVIKPNPDKENVDFLELPLDAELNERFPFLKIDEVVLGYNYNREEVNELKYSFQKIVNQNLGYTPKVSQTNLSEEYWDNPEKLMPDRE